MSIGVEYTPRPRAGAVGAPAAARVVELRGVTKRYAANEVIHGISFHVAHGEIISLLGPSGCGKTTIFRLIAGFEVPDSGEIHVQGRQVAGPRRSVPPDRRSVGMVFQDYALFPHMTAADNIMYGLEGLERRRRQAILETMLDLVGLRGYGLRYPHQLSGGEQQRVAVARALAPCPAALLLDEPFSNLDADTRGRMRKEVLEILHQAQTTAILVTHDREEAFSVGDRVGVLHGGQLEQLDTPEVVYHQPRTTFVAGFVGQADFLDAVLRDDRAVTELGCFSVRATGGCGKVRVMLRPDDVDFLADDQGTARIVGREFLGAENLYTIRLQSGQSLRSVQSSTRVVPPGTRVRILAEPEHVVVFSVL